MTAVCRKFLDKIVLNLCMDLGNRLKTARLTKGMTQAQLAESTGITERTIQRIESGAVRPSLHSLNTLEKALDIVLTKAPIVPEKNAHHLSINIHPI